MPFFLSIILRMIESFRKHFLAILASKLSDAVAILFILAKAFHG